MELVTVAVTEISITRECAVQARVRGRDFRNRNRRREYVKRRLELKQARAVIRERKRLLIRLFTNVNTDEVAPIMIHARHLHTLMMIETASFSDDWSRRRSFHQYQLCSVQT